MKGITFKATASPYIALEQVRASAAHLESTRGSGDTVAMAEALHVLELDVRAAQRAIANMVDAQNKELRKLLGMPDWD